MGEIADMMLDGTMCQGCGEWLHEGGDGLGYPGYCYGCKPRPEKKKKKSPQQNKAIKKEDGQKMWPEVSKIIQRLAAEYDLTVEWRNPGYPMFQIAALRGEGVRLVVYPHTTKGTGNKHARIRNESSPDKLRARTIMLASGFTVKMGALPMVPE